MKFKIDENLPIEVAELLRETGYDAMTIEEQNMSSADDPKVMSVCQQEQRILVTFDLDFSDIRTYIPHELPGIIILRLKQQDKRHVLEVFTRIMRLFSEDSLKHRLWIVNEKGIRIRE